MDRNILANQLLEHALKKTPKKIAVIDMNGSYSYELLEEKSNLLAAHFQQANLRKKRIAVLLPNSIELIYIYLACFKSGAVLVPLEFRDAPEETLHVYQDAMPTWLIIHEDKLGELKLVDIKKTSIEKIFIVSKTNVKDKENFYDLFSATMPFHTIEFLPTDYTFLLYTSGSTGLPKGVIYTYASTAAMINSVLDALPSISADSTFVIHDSNSHIDGLLEVLPQLYAGGTVVLRKNFDVEDFYQSLRTYRPHLIGAHINHLWQIITYPHLQKDDFRSVSQIFTGGDELPLQLQQAFIDKTGLFIQVGYGMTESIWLTITHEPYLQQRGAMGKPVNDQIKLRLVDQSGNEVVPGKIGEIWVNAPMNTLGYWNNPTATLAAFEKEWFKTGDSAYQDTNDNYWFVGRIKQIIERNSENITPYEIEQAICRHPAVSATGVIGVPDPNEGQVPVAFVILKQEKYLTEDELKKFLKTQIADYKIPKAIYFIESLPLTKSNKLNREALSTLYQKITDERM
ncbi:MAG: hypothetical protein A3F42_05855 [Gammaproteobacteria bacterium RIFCSPHIGHO2_12_FULL_37_34]|nr:MAG: hypothetical protein A3F42_05855 [Gammaproteobacteria bacterium RIFCSPHIGHO2_12_FULL_37_34]